ncbi:hypothetical protein EVAR_90261_1 [Eumeta japonica]|uniref:Uncharacterized protein n=1 Tax=Eumeta variegata TaxID=151549 RepID=A0A4C2ABK0_EUMVA|nr:hypothetical protein EVAR_90261_1 [Eumeta japonica]
MGSKGANNKSFPSKHSKSTGFFITRITGIVVSVFATALLVSALPVLPTSLPPPRPPPSPLSRSSAPNTQPQASVSPRASPRPRVILGARRNRGQRPFDRATSEFVAIEQRRLDLEEARDRHLHERETQRLQLDSQQIEISRELNQLLRQLCVIAQRVLEILSRQEPPGGPLP